MVTDSTPMREVQSVHGIRHALCPSRGSAVSGFVAVHDAGLILLSAPRQRSRDESAIDAVPAELKRKDIGLTSD